MDYNELTAWATAGAAVFAGFSLWMYRCESKRSRFTFAVDLVLRLDERFNSVYMRDKRRTAMLSIQRKIYTASAVDQVLDFFETIGYLTASGAIDEIMVWETFFETLNGYWNLTQSYVHSERQKNPSVWKNLPELYQNLLDIEKSRSNKKKVWTEKISEDFEKSEINLEEKPREY